MEPLTLDASIHTDSTSGEFIFGMFSTLVEQGSGGEIIPDVAQSWEISEDGRRYVFHLRNDVLWSDGTQVTAEDFVYRWKRTLDPATEAHIGKASMLYDIKNARAYNNGEISEPDQVGVRAIDKLTLEVELEKPASYFLHQMVQVPIPRHMVETHGESWAHWEKIVTNGPFQPESFQRGEAITLVRNPNYHGQFLGNLQGVQIKFMELQLAEGVELSYEMYKADSIDIVTLHEETFHTRHKHAEEYNSKPMPDLFFVGFDTSQPPFDDIRVRRAFASTLDKEKLANEVLDGYWYPATGGFVPPAIPGHSPGIGLPYNPSQAQSLLAQVGYPEGRGLPELTIGLFRTSKTVDYLRTQWLDNLNVEVILEILERGKYHNGLHNTNMYFRGSMCTIPDPDDFLRVSIRNNLPYWQNETYEQLLENARRTLDQSDRIRLYQAADKLLIEEAVVIPIAYVQMHYLIKPWVKLPAGGIGLWHWWKNVIIEPH
jgi:oligopeptide transport system substrate-binding protein